MDGGSFDRLTRLLASRLTRRTGLAGALGALAAAGAASAPALEARRERRRRPGRETDRAAASRSEVIDEKKPCGPKARDNRCRKHEDCCTKFCRKAKGGKKFGRCRCVKPGRKCKNGQRCCGGALCQNRKCTIQPTPQSCGAAGGACTADANCCTGLLCKNGTCAACGAVGGACTSESDCCAGLLCENGACAPCVEKVCASGCDFPSVDAAYGAAAAGATIYIGPGTYPTGIVITKDVTFAACPGATGVVLEPSRLVKDSSDSYYVVMTEDKVDQTTTHTVTLKNLALRGTATGYAASDEALLASYSYGLISWKLEGCTMSKAHYGIYASQGQHSLTNTVCSDFTYASVYHDYAQDVFTDTAPMTLTIDACTFDDAGDSYSIYFYPTNSGASVATLTVSNSLFTNFAGYGIDFEGDTTARSKTTASITKTKFNKNTKKYNPVRLNGGTFLIDGCEITENMDSAIYLIDGDLTLKDTLIKSNVAEYDAGGISVDASSANASLAVTGTTLITLNSAPTGRVGGGVYMSMTSTTTATTTGTNASNVTGNTPDQCYLFVSGNPGASGVKDCSTWT